MVSYLTVTGNYEKAYEIHSATSELADSLAKMTLNDGTVDKTRFLQAHRRYKLAYLCYMTGQHEKARSLLDSVGDVIAVSPLYRQKANELSKLLWENSGCTAGDTQ